MLAPQPIYDWLHDEWSVALKALSQAANNRAGKVSDEDHTKALRELYRGRELFCQHTQASRE